jgi:hypothetical protein
MLKLVERPRAGKDPDIAEIDRKGLEVLVRAMGKRLQSEYIEGAIPYLRQREPELWQQLEALDHEETLSALLTYERLFFEGLRRYITFLDTRQKAA